MACLSNWHWLSTDRPAIVKAMIVHVTAVQIVEGHTVWLRFDDGSEGTVDLGPLISTGPIFAELYADYSKFSAVYVDDTLRTIAWPNGADLAPETLHQLATTVARVS